MNNLNSLLLSLSLMLLLCSCSGPQLAEPKTSYIKFRDPNKILAFVGDESLRSGELQERILQRYFGQRALLGLIRERLYTAEAKKHGIEVLPEEIEQKVEEEIKSLYGESPEELRQVEAELANVFLSLKHVRAELREEFRSALLQQKLVTQMRKDNGVSDDWMAQQYERSFAQDRVFLRHIAFPVQIQNGDSEEKRRLAFQEAKQQANQLRSSLMGNKIKFPEAAQKYSGNSTSSKRGGLIGWVGPGDMLDEELTQEVFALPLGQLSYPLLQKGYGYHLFLVEEIQKACSLEEARERILKIHYSATPSVGEVRLLEDRLFGNTPVNILDDAFADPGLQKHPVIEEEQSP